MIVSVAGESDTVNLMSPVNARKKLPVAPASPEAKTEIQEPHALHDKVVAAEMEILKQYSDAYWDIIGIERL